MVEKTPHKPIEAERNGALHAPMLVPSPLSSPFLSNLPDSEWDLQQLLSVLRRRSLAIISTSVVVMTLVVSSTLRQAPVYESSFQLLIAPIESNNNLDELTSDNQNQTDSSEPDYETQIELLQSPDLLKGAVQKLQLTDSDLDYASIVDGLNISRLEETKILEISYQSTDPQEVKVVLDALAESYIQDSLTKQKASLRQGIQFIERQLPASKRRVDQLQRDLQAFRQRNDFVDPDAQAEVIAEQTNDLEQQELEVDRALAKARSVYANLQNETGAVAALEDATAYQGLIEELRQVETKRATELTRFRPESLSIRVIEEQRQNIIPLLEQEAQRIVGTKQAQASTEITTLQVQKDAIATAQLQLSQQIQQLPQLSRQYADLQREIQIATESLNRFLASYENLQVRDAQNQVPWQLVRPVEAPDAPISPNIPRNLVLGSVASLLLGVALALLLDKLNRTYHSIEELKEQTKLPLLGSLPFDKALRNWNSSKILEPTPTKNSKHLNFKFWQRSDRSDSYVYSQFDESLRLLHSNLQLLSTSRSSQSFVISSAMSGDGKTTVSCHLAQAIASLGRRVLLVDADLRRPKVHTHLGLNSEQGLSNLLTSNLSIKGVLQRPFPRLELFVICAGDVPPDPVKLLSSPKMGHMMEQLHHAFDFVIYDTPPLSGLADANTLVPHTDGLILVVGLDKTDRNLVQQALENARTTHLSVVGMIVNQLHHSPLSTNDLSYSYLKRP
jgi:polysaccharide biosynthesis transport protein